MHIVSSAVDESVPIQQEAFSDICIRKTQEAMRTCLDTYCCGCGKWHPKDGGPSVVNPIGPVNGGEMTKHEI